MAGMSHSHGSLPSRGLTGGFVNAYKEILEVSLHDQAKKNRLIRWAAVKG